jgi:hypothetical protein
MTRPSVLDVVGAVVRLASAWPQVRVWWYAPVARFRLNGMHVPISREVEPLLVVVELTERADLGALARALTAELKDYPVRVRDAGEEGAAEGRHLYRVLSPAASNGAAPAAGVSASGEGAKDAPVASE